MLANLILDENNYIINVITFPITEELPVVEIESATSIHLGIDKLVDGQIVFDQEKYQEKQERIAKAERIQELKNYLADTDYKVFKYMDGEISEEDYAVIKQARKDAREEINRLEGKLYV